MKIYNRIANDKAPIGQADPYILETGGKFYIYTTGGFCYSSTELLKNWSYRGKCIDPKNEKNIWAPCVYEAKDGFYMYYSSMDKACQDEHGQTLRVAFSHNPTGPFKTIKKILSPFSIDAHVVSNKTGMYIFYCNNDFEAVRQGTFILCDKLVSPTQVEGKPSTALVPTIDEEIYQKDRFEIGRHWHTLEGAFYFYEDGHHYLMYSGACYKNPTYFIGYAIAEGDKDCDLRQLVWKKYPSDSAYLPLMKSNSFVEGIGHNSAIKIDNQWYVVYHGRDRALPESDEDERIARIDKMEFEEGKIKVSLTS